MNDTLQLLALIGLAAVTLACVQFVFRQWRVYRAVMQTAELERDYLRERIGLITDQRRIERERSEASWNGFRKFRIVEKNGRATTSVPFTSHRTTANRCRHFSPGNI